MLNLSKIYSSPITSDWINLLSLMPKTSEPQLSIPNFRVSRVLAPVKIHQVTEPFLKGTFVTNGKYFGVVSQVISNSHYPIQISWWESNSEQVSEKFCYSWDMLQTLKIKPLALFIPQKTFLTIPNGTLVITETDELIQLSQTLFWLKSVDEAGYHLLNQNESWLFPLKDFPGIPYACLIDLPSKNILDAAKNLSLTELKVWANLWLDLNSPQNLLEQLHSSPNLASALKKAFIQSKYLQAEQFLGEDLQTAWQDAFLSYLEEKKRTVGLWGYQVSSSVVQSTLKSRLNSSKECNYNYNFGQVIELKLNSKKPVIIKWEPDENNISYDDLELKNNSISPILPFVKLSEQVGYRTSTDHKFYQAIVGFSSKAVAQSWWRSLKQELGYLSNLMPSYHPSFNPISELMPSLKYFYWAENPHQKTHTARLKHLKQVASWNLKKAYEFQR